MISRVFRIRGRSEGVEQRVEVEAGARAGRRWVLHPFLIAVFPILSLYAHNVYETPPEELVAPIGLMLFGTLAVWLAVRGLTGDTLRSALATSLLAALFFTFDLCTQAVNGLLNRLGVLWGQSEHHVHPLPMLVLLTFAAIPALDAIWRRLTKPRTWTNFLNAFSLILVALPTGSVAMARMGTSARPIVRHNEAVPLKPPLGKRPDIYYIILDAYACSDVMKNHFDFDNEPFLNRLEQKGFFVARQSTANYCQTRLSLCSSLNGDYLQSLIDPSAQDLTADTLDWQQSRHQVAPASRLQITFAFPRVMIRPSIRRRTSTSPRASR